jgi:hypothetical protein
MVHSLAIFERRDLRSTINDDAHRLRAIMRPRRNGIDTNDPAYYSVAMAMGTRRRAKQTSMWVGHGRPAAHRRASVLHANHILEQHDFDEYVEGLCERFYAEDGRPGLRRGATSGCY